MHTFCKSTVHRYTRMVSTDTHTHISTTDLAVGEQPVDVSEAKLQTLASRVHIKTVDGRWWHQSIESKQMRFPDIVQRKNAISTLDVHFADSTFLLQQT